MARLVSAGIFMNDLLPLIEDARESGEFAPLSDYCKSKGWLRNPLFVLGEWYSIFLSNGVDIFCRLCAVDDRWLYVDGVSEHNESEHSGLGRAKPVGLSNVSIEAVAFMKVGNRDRSGLSSTRTTPEISMSQEELDRIYEDLERRAYRRET